MATSIRLGFGALWDRGVVGGITKFNMSTRPNMVISVKDARETQGHWLGDVSTSHNCVIRSHPSQTNILIGWCSHYAITNIHPQISFLETKFHTCGVGGKR